MRKMAANVPASGSSWMDESMGIRLVISCKIAVKSPPQREIILSVEIEMPDTPKLVMSVAAGRSDLDFFTGVGGCGTCGGEMENVR